MINNNEFDRIISYGCSYTSGQELLDHKILNMTLDECNKLKQTLGNNNFYDIYKFLIRHEENINATWSAELAKLLSKKYETKSIPGSSIEHAYFLIYHDMINGHITDRDLVLVGLTAPSRVFNLDCSANNLSAYSFVIGQLPTRFEDQDKEFHKMLLSFFNKDLLWYNYYKTIKILGDLRHRINIKLQPMENITWFGDISKSLIPILDSMLHDSADVILNMYDFLDTRNFSVCGFNHPSHEAHVSLANRLFDKNFTT